MRFLINLFRTDPTPCQIAARQLEKIKRMSQSKMSEIISETTLKFRPNIHGWP